MVQESREAVLIHAARGGQVSAFNQLVRAYQGPVYNLAYRIVGDPQMAMDVTQDTFLRAAQRLSRVRQGSVKVCLMRILVETCRSRLSRSQPPAGPGATPILAKDRQAIPDQALRECEDEALQAFVNRLPLEQRIVLVLSDVGDLKYSEIAASTGVSVKIVRTRLSQGRAGLRDALWAKSTPLPAPAETDHAPSYEGPKRMVG
jgi:RNA polymerase sigma-70 factor (ECF subfamily)